MAHANVIEDAFEVECRCDNCEYGCEKLPGVYCDTALDTLHAAGFHYIRTLVMAENGHCPAFEPSDEAIEEARAAQAEEAYVNSRAGIDYPASLARV